MRRFVFLILFGINTLYAQNNIIDLSKDTLYIDPMGYSLETVIDARENKSCIGYITNGMGNKNTRELVNFKNGTVQELKALISKSLQLHQKPLIIRVNKLYAYQEHYKLSVVEINLSFIEKEKSSYIEKYRGIATVHAKHAFNATNNHADNILEAIEICFKQFKEAKSLINKPLTEFELYVPLKQDISPVLTQPLKKGIYYSLIEFRNNTPDSSIAIDDSGYVSSVISSELNRKEKYIWGYSDGKQAFIKIDRHFTPISIENSICTFWSYPLQLDPKTKEEIIIAGISGGLILASIVTTIEGLKQNEIEYLIDFTAGKIVPYNDINGVSIGNKIIFFASELGIEDKEIEIFLDDIKLCHLKKNNYYILNTSQYSNQVTICFLMNGVKTCDTFFPSSINAEAYECWVSRKNKLNTKLLQSNNLLKELYHNIDDGNLIRVCK